MRTAKFGRVEINLDTAPTNKTDFYEKYKGLVPDIAKAWEEVKKKASKKAK